MKNDIKDLKTDVSGLKSEMNTKFDNVNEALKKIMKKLQIE